MTADRNLPHQQNLADFELAVVILGARTNRMADLAPLVPPLREALERLRPGDLVTVGE